MMTKEEAINILIKDTDTNKISDGYHTFEQLYEHRIFLYIALVRLLVSTGKTNSVWKTKIHSDGSVWDGWFLLGIGYEKGKQITYHLPMKYYHEIDFVVQIDKAPEFDGHTSEDVLIRIASLSMNEEQPKEPVNRNKQGYIIEDLTKWKPRFIGEIDPSTLPEKDSVKAEKKRMQAQIDKLTNDIEEQAASFLILLKGARNAALSEAIEKVKDLICGSRVEPLEIIEILEGLKIK